MSGTSLLTMVLVLAIVWGGLTVLLAVAVRKERQKSGSTSKASLSQFL